MALKQVLLQVLQQHPHCSFSTPVLYTPDSSPIHGALSGVPMQHKVISPLVIPRTKSSNFSLNLNIYRNTHYKVLNNMKIVYKGIMASSILKLPSMKKVTIEYVLYPKTKALCDVANVCSVVDKFFSDALVELGKLPDDNYLYIPKIIYSFGGVDKVNPRVEILIQELE